MVFLVLACGFLIYQDGLSRFDDEFLTKKKRTGFFALGKWAFQNGAENFAVAILTFQIGPVNFAMSILTFQSGAENFAMAILTFPKCAAHFPLAFDLIDFGKPKFQRNFFWPKVESADALGIYPVRLFHAYI